GVITPDTALPIANSIKKGDTWFSDTHPANADGGQRDQSRRGGQEPPARSGQRPVGWGYAPSRAGRRARRGRGGGCAHGNSSGGGGAWGGTILPLGAARWDGRYALPRPPPGLSSGGQ
ncbi:hypothetical protein ACWCO3_33040, partial [Micromonospora sp. NPDC002411]